MRLTHDEVFRVVCNIRTPVDNNAFLVGTGMFVANESKIWLVTAAHVAEKTNENTVIAIGNDDHRCSVFPLKLFNGQSLWMTHSEADLAVMPVNVTNNNIALLCERCFPLDYFNFSNKAVSRDTELTSVGFPNGLGTEGLFSPLTFRSYASSSFLTLARSDTHTPAIFFCLENPSCGGYSGCPIFDLGYRVVGNLKTFDGDTICHGIMHGTISDDTGGKIAVVTPAFYLKDLLL